MLGALWGEVALCYRPHTRGDTRLAYLRSPFATCSRSFVQGCPPYPRLQNSTLGAARCQLTAASRDTDGRDWVRLMLAGYSLARVTLGMGEVD